MSSRISAVILAAGKGTRMRSERPKVLHEVLGRPLIDFPVRLAGAIGVDRVVVVTGHGREAVEARVTAIAPGAVFAVQEEQRGTGHAVLAAESATFGVDSVLILSGDVPLTRPETLERMLAAHRDGAPIVVLGFRPPDLTGYGRILGPPGQADRIVEDRDAGPDEKPIRLCNAGLYVADRAFLFEALRDVGSSNDQGEVYLTDVIAAAGGRARVVEVDDPWEVSGANDRADLAALAARLQADRNGALMRAGVTMLAPERTIVGLDVEVAADATIHADVTLLGRTRVAAGATVGQGVVAVDALIGVGAEIRPYCVLTQATVGAGAAVGPFAHLRPGSDLREGSRVGNFVETKNTILGPGSKANHLSYLGDATVGRNVNVGAGTITCNYDGVGKHRTILEDGVFVGSNTELVAPVRVGEEALIGAGTTVTRDVPAGALVLSRAEQVHLEGWAARHGPAAKKRRKERSE